MKKINIVSVWTWFSNVLDTQTLSASEQLIMLHLIKIFNRNFWKPAKISMSAICRSCGKDARTVKRSISLLKSANLLTETDEGLFLNFGDEDKSKTKSLTANNPLSHQKQKISTAKLPDFQKGGYAVPTELDIQAMKFQLEHHGKLREKHAELYNQCPPKLQREIKGRLNEMLKGMSLNF